MSSIALLRDPKRDARIAAILATTYIWVSARRKADSKPFFYIPGSNGAVYMTAEDGCTCPAAQRFDGLCKHSKAAVAHLAQKMAPTPVRRPSVLLAPVCSEAGCDDDAGRTGRCWQHARQVAA